MQAILDNLIMPILIPSEKRGYEELTGQESCPLLYGKCQLEISGALGLMLHLLNTICREASEASPVMAASPTSQHAPSYPWASLSHQSQASFNPNSGTLAFLWAF